MIASFCTVMTFSSTYATFLWVNYRSLLFTYSFFLADRFINTYSFSFSQMYQLFFKGYNNNLSFYPTQFLWSINRPLLPLIPVHTVFNTDSFPASSNPFKFNSIQNSRGDFQPKTKRNSAWFVSSLFVCFGFVSATYCYELRHDFATNSFEIHKCA